jgi:hypothetical protein
VLLFEDRGGTTTYGLGAMALSTNTFPTRTSGDYNANTNSLEVGRTRGTLSIDYDFYAAPDTMHVYRDGALIYNSGLVSFANHISIPFGPSVSTNIVIIMNEGNNDDTNTLWEYTPTVISFPAYVVFTDNTNQAPVPIKFASPPFLPTGTNWDLYCLPEQSLNSLAGESACGTWQLEMRDARGWSADLAPELASWQLRFVFQNTLPVPIGLTPGITRTSTIPSGQVAPFFVDVPAWATQATNLLVYASAPVNLLFDQDVPPTGTNAEDVTLLSASTGGMLALETDGTPPLVPGARYYLGIQNPGIAPVTAIVQVDFDVTPLTNSVPLNATQDGTAFPRYFSYEASSNGTAVSFQLLNLDGNLDLAARGDLPYPTTTSFDYASFNPAANDEEILVFTNSSPVPLAPGRWYLGVFNADLTNINYTILVTEYTNPFPTITTLTNGVPCSNTNSGAGDATDYYRYVVSGSALRAQFEIDGPTGDMTLVARKGLPLPTLTNYDCLSANPGLNDELITLFDVSTPLSLTPGDWFLSAVNVSGGPAAYAIKAAEFTTYGTNITITSYQSLSDSFCLGWTSVPGIRYYVQGKTSLNDANWAAVSPTLTADDVLTTYCIPLSSSNHFFRVSEGLAVMP